MMTWGAPTLFRKVTAQEGNRSNQIGLMRRSVSAFALLSFGAGVAVQRHFGGSAVLLLSLRFLLPDMLVRARAGMVMTIL